MEFSDLVSLLSGYRHQDGELLFDAEMSEPMPGLTFRFRFGMNGSILCNQ